MSRRTGGPPTNPTEDIDTESDMVVDIPDTSSERSSHPQRNSSTGSSRRHSTRSHTSNVVDYGDDDDDDDNGDNANQSGGNRSVSSQAPMPSNRHQRTRSLSSTSALPSPTRMASMSSSELTDTFRNYNRGGGG